MVYSKLLAAKRTEGFQESVIREMTRVAIAENAINLSQGLPDFSPTEALVDAARKAIDGPCHQYSITHGMMSLREAVGAKLAARNGLSLDPEHEITVTCGVSEGIVCSILALVDPGDEVIVFEPFYENYLPAIAMAGGRPRFVTLPFGDWSLPEQALKDAFGARTKAIIVNTPMNPTGKVFTREELGLIADLCAKYEVVAITDEIYEDIVYDGKQHMSLGGFEGMGPQTVTVGGFSKTYAVTGWRVGYVAASRPLSAAVRKVHDYLTICAPTPFQHACLTALNLPSEYYGQMRRAYESRRDLFCSGLEAAGFQVAWPGGAYYVLVDFSALGWEDDWQFAFHLARCGGVAAVPGTSFYRTAHLGDKMIRFSFAMRERTLAEALVRITERVREKA